MRRRRPLGRNKIRHPVTVVDVDATTHDCADDLADTTVDDGHPVDDDAAVVDDGATGHRHLGPVHDDPGDDGPGSA